MVGACLAPYRFAAFLVLQEIAAFAGAAFLAARCGPELAARMGGPLLAWAALEGIFALGQWFRGSFAAGDVPESESPGGVARGGAAGGCRNRGDGPAPGNVARAALAVPAALVLAILGSRGAFLALIAGGGWLLARSWSGSGLGRGG